MNVPPVKQKSLSDHINLAAHILSSLATFTFATAAIVRLAEDGRLKLEEEKDRGLWIAR